MKNNLVLIVDDEQPIRYAFKKTLEPLKFTVIEAENGLDGVKISLEKEPSLIFLDVTMPEMNGLDALGKIRSQQPKIPIVIITGYGNMETAIKAMQLGAYDYLTKPLDIDKVRITTQRAIEMTQMKTKIDELQHELEQHKKTERTNLIGQHPKMQEIFKKIGVISTTPNTTNILILGETGTGKELVAKAIHESGQHPDQPFQAINCTVLPENLLESELFGHERGAFTGAINRKIGKFELAGEGTLFLDEIGDMSETLQKKLLRVTQERAFERLGGNEQIKLNARIIAATHINLDEAIKKGKFREDLYYRLNVFEMVLPNLKDKKEDIPLLVNYFLNKYCTEFGKNISGIASEVFSVLMEYDFPGNVRELENLIERAVALERSEILTTESFPPYILQSSNQESVDIPLRFKEFIPSKQFVIEAFEKKFLIERLKETRGNVSEAARISGIERQSLQRLMKKYNLQSEDFKK